MSAGETILLVESDRTLAERLVGELAADGFRVRLARSAEHARSLASQGSPELVLLGELQEPSASTALLKEIRGGGGQPGWHRRDLPLLVIGRGRSEHEAIRCFEAGADDFMTVPLSYLELRARVRAILRRTSTAPVRRLITAGSLTMDLDARRVTLAGQAVELCRTEFELLALLIKDHHRVLTRSELLLGVWGRGPGGASRTLDTHAGRLRRKLDSISPDRWIPSVRGVGYRLI